MDIHGTNDDITNINNDDTGNANANAPSPPPAAGANAQRPRTGGATLSPEQLATITQSVTAAVLEVMASQGVARPTGGGPQRDRVDDPGAGEADDDAPGGANTTTPDAGNVPREPDPSNSPDGRPGDRQLERTRSITWNDVERRVRETELVLEQYPANPYFRSERVARRSGGYDRPSDFNIAALDNTHPVVLVGNRQRGRDQEKSTAGARNLAEFVASYPIVSYGFDLRQYLRDVIVDFENGPEAGLEGEEREGSALFGALVYTYRCFSEIYEIAERRITYIENRLRAHDPEASSGERALYGHEAEQYEETHRLDGLSSPAMREKMRSFMSSREAAMYKQLAKGEAERRLPTQRGRWREEKKNPDAAKRTGGAK